MVIKKLIILVFFLSPVLLAGSCEEDKEKKYEPPTSPATNVDADLYLTNPDRSSLFALQETAITSVTDNSLPEIKIDKDVTYQTIDGFGYTLTGGSAKLLHKMSTSKRALILNELFRHDNSNIGVSYLRVSLGSSDLDEYTFSYNSTVGDVDMNNFDLGYDRQYLIPVLKEILSIVPDIKILASPWSAPVWMKTNNETVGGSLKTEYYDAYALYFVKYVTQMEEEDIIIDAITVQNEPLHGGNNPSMVMTSAEQTDFVKNNLGPAFEDAGISTKIIIYDHNADRTDYPISVLNDADAKKYINGSAFHLYGGSISALSSVHTAHPDKDLYFTEQWIGAPGNFPDDIRWHTREVIIGSTRNWCKVALEWNLAADPSQDPHTLGGCTQCLGALTIDGDNITRNPAYYIIAHAAKFVRPGSVRIESNYLNELPNVAFLTPDNEIVLIVLNDSGSNKYFNINLGEESISSSLKDGAVGTFVIDI